MNYEAGRQKAAAGKALLAAEIVDGVRRLRERRRFIRLGESPDAALTMTTLMALDLETVVGLFVSVHDELANLEQGESDYDEDVPIRPEVREAAGWASGVKVRPDGYIVWRRFDA